VFVTPKVVWRQGQTAKGPDWEGVALETFILGVYIFICDYITREKLFYIYIVKSNFPQICHIFSVIKITQL
jgi:hypothetical protein